MAALILQPSFTNTSHLASQFFLPGFLVLEKYNNLAAVSEYASPVLIFHGEHDGTVPFPHAQELVAAAANGELISMECGHSDCPQNNHEFWGLVEFFLQKKIF